jgi:hypothetical protein
MLALAMSAEYCAGGTLQVYASGNRLLIEAARSDFNVDRRAAA